MKEVVVQAKPYPEYKPSGIEWLGNVPEHWGVKRLRYLSTIQKGRLPGETFSSPTADSDLPYLSMDFLRGETDSPNYAATSTSLVLAEDGDLLLLWDGSNAGEFLTAKKGVVSSTIARLDATGIETKFLSYACKALEPQIKDQTIGMGIPHVSGDELKSCSLPCPTRAEQQIIATFLDRETRRMNRLIARKLELIERLKEKRIALISRTVVCGLPPAVARVKGFPVNPPLKPSTLNWLGNIPAHWMVKRLKHLGSIVSGCAFDSRDFTSSGIRVLKIANIQTLRLDWSDESFLPEEFYYEYPTFVVHDGDVVFALTRPIISTGLKAAIAAIGDERVLLNQRNALFRPRPQLNRHFLYHALFSVSFKASFETQIDFTGQQPNISPIDIGNIKIPVPPLSEQTAIAVYLDEETAKLDTLVAKVETAVERLQEYRGALITAAVTGKIDVRKESNG